MIGACFDGCRYDKCDHTKGVLYFGDERGNISVLEFKGCHDVCFFPVRAFMDKINRFCGYMTGHISLGLKIAQLFGAIAKKLVEYSKMLTVYVAHFFPQFHFQWFFCVTLYAASYKPGKDRVSGTIIGTAAWPDVWSARVQAVQPAPEGGEPDHLLR